MLEQQWIVKFLFKKGNKPPNIIQRFENVYGNKGVKKMQVYFWIAEVYRGYKDLSDEEEPGKSPDTGLGDVLAHRLEADWHKRRKIAGSLGFPRRQ
jgi:hypothetical protein